jgi:hypothetical protein
MKRKDNGVDENWTELFRTWEKPSFSHGMDWIVSAVIEYKYEHDVEIIKVKVEYDSDRLAYVEVFNELNYSNKHFDDDDRKLSECLLSIEDFTPLFLDLQSAKIPVVGFSLYCGLDGTTYGIYIENYATTIELEWWCEGPEEWREFTSAVNKMQKFLKSQIEKSKSDIR